MPRGFRRSRDRLIDGVLERIPFTRLNGPRENRLPNNASFCFEFVEGEGLLLMLDMKGIAGASGSACTSGSLDPSHVLLALGLSHEIAHGSLRLTLGTDTTQQEIDTVLEVLPPHCGAASDDVSSIQSKKGRIASCIAKK